ncbi:MAG: NfeD family protein [Candidatus Cloacimonetes bacterium]|nr:NfeD family protein [Candidatus Cloacimonadota bacterium]
MEVWLDPWMVWIFLGIICIIIEIFTPGFLFLSFGIGAILTGITAFLIDSIVLQVILFALITLFVFLLSRKLSNKFISKDYIETNVKGLIGKTGKVTQDIQPDEKGYVKVESEEWVAVAKKNVLIKKDSLVIVEGIDGNKVIVTVKKVPK